MATQSKDFDSFNNMNTSLLDMQTCEEGIVVLTAADNTNYSNQFDLALGIIFISQKEFFLFFVSIKL